ncbi:hypothetical protein FACS1894147_00640 [Spirochaetia bacterium]|nr:hypothetical protein FACS1894147_00640 [Spirochaetia bacterium]
MNLKPFFVRLPYISIFFILAACAGKPAVTSTTANGPDDLDAVIRATSNYLNGRLPGGIKVVFLNFQSEWPDLSEYVIEGLIENTVNDGVFKAVDRENLTLIQQEMDFQLSGEVSDETAQSIGAKLGAQTIVSGAISRLGDSYRLRVRAIGVETAEIQGQFNRDIPPGPRIVALTASNAAPVSRTAQLSGNTQPQPGVVSPTQTSPGGSGAASIPAGTPALNGSVIAYERFVPLRTLNRPGIGGFSNLEHETAFTADGKGLLTNDFRANPPYIKLWDIETGTVTRRIRESYGVGSPIAVSPDGKKFVTTGSGNRLLLWDLTAGAYRECSGHTNTVTSIAFSPDGNSFISSSNDKTIKIWSAETGQEIRTLTGHTGTGNIGQVLAAAYSPNGQQIVSGSNDDTIKFWSAANGTVLQSISVPKGTGPRVLAWCPDGRRIATAQGNRIRILDVENGRELFLLSDTYGPIAFSPDGRRLLSFRGSGGARTIVIWNMDNGWELGRLNVGGGGGQVSLAMSPDGKHFVVGVQESQVTIWGEE